MTEGSISVMAVDMIHSERVLVRWPWASAVLCRPIVYMSGYRAVCQPIIHGMISR
jgi:hypothetical protein